jgi:hypothetical protein
VLMQREVIQGPPAYFTPDWVAAGESVRRLAALEPRIAATGHGRPLQGPAMLDALHRLAREFERVSVPEHGRYVGRPATADETGTTYVSPDNSGLPRAAWLIGGAVLAAGLLAAGSGGRRRRRRSR